jgi:DNA-binding transcriptional regulator YiaG
MHHHYLCSGLPNVWLENGYHIKQTDDHGEVVAIEDVRGLHRAIGGLIAKKTSPLTGEEFRFLRKELELSQDNLARIIGKSSQAVALWEKNLRVPLIADRFMRSLYLEATTGIAGIMKQIETINRMDHRLHEIAMRLDEEWHGDEKAA